MSDRIKGAEGTVRGGWTHRTTLHTKAPILTETVNYENE